MADDAEGSGAPAGSAGGAAPAGSAGGAAPAGSGGGAGPTIAEPEIQPTWRRSLRDVSWVAASVVAIVLGAAFVTDLLPAPVRALVVDTPLAILVLVLGTAWLLWQIARKPSDPGS